MKKHPVWKTGGTVLTLKYFVILGTILFLAGLFSIWLLTDYFCNRLEGKVREDYKAASVVADEEENETIDWELVLVNPWNSLPENYEVPLIDIGGGWRI